MARHWLIAGGGIAAGCVAALVPIHSTPASPEFRTPRPRAEIVFRDHAAARAFHESALAAADIWSATDPRAADLFANPPDPGGLLSTPIVSCRFLAVAADGTTPKFRCVLTNGEVVKVKYGHTREVPAELAATRLLRAVGFGADHEYLVPKVRCYGCPNFPFHVMWTLELFRARQLVADRWPASRYTDFAWPAVERPLAGVEVADGDAEGWAWYELEATRQQSAERLAEIDALRLMAVFLAHWDNKAENQRLLCRSGADPAAGVCSAPFAFIQDLGSTFGPKKVDLAAWEAVPIWDDRDTCRVSMRQLPYRGGTFDAAVISEAGRALLTKQLEALSDAQIESLFRGARFAELDGSSSSADVSGWIRTFKAKVRDLSSAAPCPSPPYLSAAR
jgi:hypothetical protein